MGSNKRISASETKGLCTRGRGANQAQEHEWLRWQQQELLSLYVSVLSLQPTSYLGGCSIISIGSSRMQKASQCVPIYKSHPLSSGSCTSASAKCCALLLQTSAGGVHPARLRGSSQIPMRRWQRCRGLISRTAFRPRTHGWRHCISLQRRSGNPKQAAPAHLGCTDISPMESGCTCALSAIT